MGQNQSSPTSAGYATNPRLSRDLKGRLSVLDYENSNPTDKAHNNSLKKSSSFIHYAPSREKQLFRDDMSCSYNEYSEARISSTTLKSKRSSTVKSYTISQDRRRSEDFDMGQMEENADVLRKNPNVSENNPCLESTVSRDAALLRSRRRNIGRHPKSSSFLLSSSQTSSAVSQNHFKPEHKIGPHIADKKGQQLQGKQVEDEVDAVLKTETNEGETEPVDIVNKDLMHYTESSLCRMESVGFTVADRYKESKNGDDEVRILETCGSRLSSPRQTSNMRSSPELELGYSHKKPSMKKEENRYAHIMIASYEDDQLGSRHIKDSDIMSLSSSEAEPSPVNDFNRNFSPEKTNKSFKSLSRKDGEYQEVEFSFKPSSLTKGSRRYTTDGDVMIEPTRYQLPNKPEKLEFDQQASLENPLTENQCLNSLESFCFQQPSAEKVIADISPCKSSANKALIDNIKNLSPTILHDSKELPYIDTTKDVSKDSQARVESPLAYYQVTDFESKTMTNDVFRDSDAAPVLSLPIKNSSLERSQEGESVVYDKEILMEEGFRSSGDGKENRPVQTNQNMYKLQQIITKSETKSKGRTETVKSPGMLTTGRLLNNMKKGIKNQMQGMENEKSGLLRVKNYYQFQGSVSDKGNSFSKEASANSSSFLRVLKDNENISKTRINSGYTLRDDSTSLFAGKRANIRNDKLKLRTGNNSNESQTSFQIDDSVSRLEKRRKSELNTSKFQRGGPVKCHNKTLVQETCCVSTATSGNEFSVNSLKLTKQPSKAEIGDNEDGHRNLHKGARSVTRSRGSSLLKNQSKKSIKDFGSSRESPCPEEPLYTLILPVTSPKEDIFAKSVKSSTENRNSSLSQRTKLNKTSPYGILSKEDFSQADRTIKTPTDHKRYWSDKEIRPKSAANKRKSEIKLGFNETLDFGDKSFLKITSEIKSDKINEGGQSSKMLKNLLRGQIERPQRKDKSAEKSERDIKTKSMSRTLNLQEKSESKSPYLKKRFEAR